MNIFSIIVAFSPDIDCLNDLIKNILSGGSKVIVVDNSKKSQIHKFDDFDLIELNDNLGIAKAQNIGIKKAIDNAADVIIFFDQDSVIDFNFIKNISKPLNINKPMITSPIFVDEKTSFHFPSMKFNKFGLLNSFDNSFYKNPFPVDLIISSGSAVTSITFEEVGLMDEKYFIDFVDTEFSLRCRKKDIPILAVPAAKMKHTIGNKMINFFIFRVFIHSPIRSYYKIRNAFIFIKNKNVPFLFGLKNIISAITHNFIPIIISKKEKMQYFKYYFLALKHGFLGVTGKLIK
jgi:rhamnosyltransferase